MGKSAWNESWPARLTALCTLVVLIGSVAPAHAQQRTQPDPAIAALMGQVQTGTLMTYDGQLSGETEVTVGGAPYRFITRDSTSGEPIEKATQFAAEFLQAHGLSTHYENWSNCGITGRNVIGEKLGTQKPDEIVLITAHLDSLDLNGGTVAPGADDNGSGSVGVMAAAEILAAHQFQRTMRFIFTTGEEQDLCGSRSYATAHKENIKAFYNMDMIAYDANNDGVVHLDIRRTSQSGYADDKAIADTFVAVVAAYGLPLSPTIDADFGDLTDAYSFWTAGGYPGMTVIEDDSDSGDFNPVYDTADDKVTVLNQTYFTNMTKAAIGTVAQLAILDDAPVEIKFHTYMPAVKQ